MRRQRGVERVRRSAAEWRGIVEEQKQSGMSVAAFAADHGLNRHTLQWWRCHHAKAGGPSAFIEIRAPLELSRDGARLESMLPSGVIVRGHDGDQLARLVAALLRPC